MDVKFSGQLALFYFLVFLDFSNFYPLFPPHSCHSAGQHFSTLFNQTRESETKRTDVVRPSQPLRRSPFVSPMLDNEEAELETGSPTSCAFERPRSISWLANIEPKREERERASWRFLVPLGCSAFFFFNFHFRRGCGEPAIECFQACLILFEFAASVEERGVVQFARLPAPIMCSGRMPGREMYSLEWMRAICP